jgi:hypothetical protein
MLSGQLEQFHFLKVASRLAHQNAESEIGQL